LERGVFSSKIIIKAPGLTDEMEAISKNEAEQIMLYVKNSMDKIKIESQKQIGELKESLADELLKLANLRDKGILNDEEFLKMKKDLLNKRPD
jgi:hypothetical protein